MVLQFKRKVGEIVDVFKNSESGHLIPIMSVKTSSTANMTVEAHSDYVVLRREVSIMRRLLKPHQICSQTQMIILDNK